MENKYYVPDLKEFHVGFKYEVQQLEELYGEVTYTNEYANFNYEFGDKINLERVRVKYLDKQDIESFGFVQNKILPYQFFNGIYLLILDKHNRVSLLHRADDMYVLHNANIKNKSELKDILLKLEIIW